MIKVYQLILNNESGLVKDRFTTTTKKKATSKINLEKDIPITITKQTMSNKTNNNFKIIAEYYNADETNKKYMKEVCLNKIREFLDNEITEAEREQYDLIRFKKYFFPSEKEETKFYNSIEYNLDCIRNYDDFYTSNLSTLLFTQFEEYTDDFIEEPFDLKALLDVDKCIKIEEHYNETILKIHPMLKELSFAFNTKLIDLKIRNIKDQELVKTRVENSKNLLKKHINLLMDEINTFIIQRRELLEGKDVRFLGYDEEKSTNISRLIFLLNETLPTRTLTTDDFEFLPEGIMCKNKKEYTVKNLYNFEGLLLKLKTLALNDNEYYSLERYNRDRTKDEIDNMLDEINSSTFFNKETFAILYIKLEGYLKKEYALNKFINQILFDEHLNI